jgi:hypothetical protein
MLLNQKRPHLYLNKDLENCSVEEWTRNCLVCVEIKLWDGRPRDRPSIPGTDKRIY